MGGVERELLYQVYIDFHVSVILLTFQSEKKNFNILKSVSGVSRGICKYLNAFTENYIYD